MDIVYTMPGQNHRLFINVVHSCPNACLFCVDFKGDAFYGFDLKQGKPPSTEEIVSSVAAYPNKSEVSEIYFCGIGEPLLRYEPVIESARRIRTLLGKETCIAINTSGTFFGRDPRVDFAKEFDLIQVSLNAENEEKYNQICRPKIPDAYSSVMAFLDALRRFLTDTKSSCRVELSVVDTSKIERLPRREQFRGKLPIPDFIACQKIADRFGWPLKIKELMPDCEDSGWRDFATQFRAQSVDGRAASL